MLEQFIIIVLFAFLVLCVFGIIVLKDLMAGVVLLGMYSLTSASIFLVMDAVDVAFTEAAVGAGISTILFLGALSFIGTRQKIHPKHHWVEFILVSLTGILLIYGTLDLPGYGDPNSPAQTHPDLTQHFIDKSMEETGIPNVVTSVLASYRGYDTLGETVVVFTAGIAVLSLLMQPKRRPLPKPIPTPVAEKPIRRDHTVLRFISKLIIPFTLLFALYVQFHGDFGPGGGFQAGVIFAAAFILHGMVFGTWRTNRIMTEIMTERLMALGVLIYLGTGVVTLLLHGAYLDFSVLSHDPVHGQHWGIFSVELGVGITVCAVMVNLFYHFAEARE